MSDLRLDDDRLAVVLASVGEHLVVEPGRDARTTGTGRSPWRPLLVAAMTLAVVAGAVLAIAPARRAVSGWFRVGRIELDIDRRPSRTGLPSLTDAASQIEPSAVEALLGQAMPAVDHSVLGHPSHWWTIPEGGVLVGWPDGETSLWISATGGGEQLVDKIVAAEADVIELANLGDGGVGVHGSHILQTPHRRVAADSVVIWTDGALTWRLEGTAALDDLVEIARQLDPGSARAKPRNS